MVMDYAGLRAANPYAFSYPINGDPNTQAPFFQINRGGFKLPQIHNNYYHKSTTIITTNPQQLLPQIHNNYWLV